MQWGVLDTVSFGYIRSVAEQHLQRAGVAPPGSEMNRRVLCVHCHTVDITALVDEVLQDVAMSSAVMTKLSVYNRGVTEYSNELQQWNGACRALGASEVNATTRKQHTGRDFTQVKV